MHGEIIARDLFNLDAQYFQDLFVTRSLSVAGYVILVYECLATLPDEVQYIWPTRWSTVKIIYILNRYGNLLQIALANAQLIGVWWDQSPSFCFRVTLVLSFFQFASFASIHVLVLLRAWATWGRRKKMLSLLVALFVAYASVSIMMLTYGIVKAGYNGYPYSSVTRTCIGVLPGDAWVLWVPSLVLECAIFVLTMVSVRQYQVHRRFKEQPALVQVLCRDAIAYFFVTLFSSLFNILTWTRDANRPLNMLSNTYVIAILPARYGTWYNGPYRFTLCLMIVAGQRLVLDLRKETDYNSLSTTRLGREIERAIEALPRSRTPSPIVFVDRGATRCASPQAIAVASQEPYICMREQNP
ncbi:hypothetical protein FKP32DRAFT_1675297 [Trametes sanguinea]|nr:hypothetical protein FKP32DRAFT_1675297 [Trametes sanguinea]